MNSALRNSRDLNLRRLGADRIFSERDVDRHLLHERFQCAPQLIVRNLLRYDQERLDLEQLLGGRSAADDLGVEVLDADAASGKTPGQFANDPGPIMPDQFELDSAAPGGNRYLLLLGDDDVYSRRLQSAQGGGQRVGVLRRYFEMHQAGELPGEGRNATSGPVGAEALRLLRQETHNSGTIGARHRRHERCDWRFSFVRQ